MKKSKLEIFRKKLGLSRYRVAQDAGIEYSTLMRLEDVTRPKIDRKALAKLLEYYGPELTIRHLLE